MIFSLVLITSLVGHSLTLSPLGFTLHGKKPEAGTPEHMPYKLDKDGVWTVHPMLALNYKHKYVQAAGFYFRDSFGKHAGGLTFRPNLPIHKYVNLGFMGGLYMRQNYPGIRQFPGSIRTKDVEYIPMAVGTLQIAIPVTDKISIEPAVAGNYIVNLFTLGCRYDF